MFVFKQKTAYVMRMCDWSSDVCSSDLGGLHRQLIAIALIADNHQRRIGAVDVACGQPGAAIEVPQHRSAPIQLPACWLGAVEAHPERGAVVGEHVEPVAG